MYEPFLTLEPECCTNPTTGKYGDHSALPQLHPERIVLSPHHQRYMSIWVRGPDSTRSSSLSKMTPDEQGPSSAGLTCNVIRCRRDRFLIAEVTASEKVEVLVQFVHRRHTGRDVEAGDVLVGDALEVLDEGTE